MARVLPYQGGMLRIVHETDSKSRLVLVLEGWLEAESLAVLAQEVQNVRTSESRFVVDVSRVSYVDRRAIEFLRDLQQDGIRLIGASDVLEKLMGD